ncbi:hypothetical protein IAR50_003970 [Cryptococcus sp. DSM 104548]
MSYRKDLSCLGDDKAPNTPLPYELSSYFAPLLEGSLQSATSEDKDRDSPTLHSKRPRDSDESEQEWTTHELGLLENILSRPSSQYAPGSLPPPSVLDEFTTRIVQPQQTAESTAGPQKSRSPENTMIWLHSWESTRQKITEIALEYSRFGIEAERRKLPREVRSERPGLRRMDSMDFLDDGDGTEGSGSGVGRAICLSTTLQKSAAGPSKDTERDMPMPTITLAPAPTQKLPSALPPKVPGRRLPAGLSRPSSLLQRGRSFTAEDLQAESLRGGSPVEEPKKQENDTASSRELSVVSQGTSKASTDKRDRAGMTRSYSSFSVADPAPHAAQKSFISSPVPTTDHRSLLAVPTEIPTIMGSQDNDESKGSRRNRTAKRFKLAQKLDMSKVAPPLPKLSLLGEVGPNGLDSPFEEEKGLGR